MAKISGLAGSGSKVAFMVIDENEEVYEWCTGRPHVRAYYGRVTTAIHRVLRLRNSLPPNIKKNTFFVEVEMFMHLLLEDVDEGGQWRNGLAVRIEAAPDSRWRTRGDIKNIIGVDSANLVHQIKLDQDAFDPTTTTINLGEKLRSLGCQDIVVMGSYAGSCVTDTIRSALNNGFKIYSSAEIIRDYDHPDPNHLDSARTGIDSLPRDRFFLFDRL